MLSDSDFVAAVDEILTPLKEFPERLSALQIAIEERVNPGEMKTVGVTIIPLGFYPKKTVLITEEIRQCADKLVALFHSQGYLSTET